MTKKSFPSPNKKEEAGIAVLVLYGAVLGVMAAKILFAAADRSSSFEEYLAALAGLAVLTAAALYLQIILHEGGHLVCGLLSGYRFVSFRIGSWMLQKENGKLCLHRYTLAGTGGQCLLAPPEMTNGKMPYQLYNLGGVLMNLFTAVLAAGLMWACREAWPARIFFEMLCVAGLGSALTNGIPLRIQGVANDGANARDLGKDPAALRAFWVQLSINAKQAECVALREMPEEWFALPTEGLDNIMVAVQAVLHANRLMDQQRFAETAQVIDALEAQKTAVLPLHRNLLLCDRLTCALLTGEDAAPWLKRWNRKEMRNFRKQMKTFPSVLRTEYAAALLAEKAPARAETYRVQFARQAKNYPFAAETASECALMERLAQMSQTA